MIFADILTSMDVALPLLTRILMMISDFFRSYSWVFLILIVGAVFAFRAFYATPNGRRAVDQFTLNAPLLGPIQRKGAIASFSSTLSLLISSGVNIIESLEITKGTANNAIVEEAIENGKNVVTVGEPLSGSLAASPVFPAMVTSMVSIGEETGALDEMLSKVADFYDREVEEAIDSLTAAIEPIMIVVLGGIILVIMLGMFMPMMSIMEHIG